MSAPTLMTGREARIQEILGDLFRERRALRARGIDRGLLEANRLSIVYWQRQLRDAGDAGGGTRARMTEVTRL